MTRRSVAACLATVTLSGNLALSASLAPQPAQPAGAALRPWAAHHAV